MGKSDWDEDFSTALHSHSDTSTSSSSDVSSSEEKEPSAPCKVGVVEASIVVQFLKLKEQRSTFQVIFRIQRLNGLTALDPESTSTLII